MITYEMYARIGLLTQQGLTPVQIAGLLVALRAKGETVTEIAAAADHGAVIWIHDTQPVMLSPADSLRQRMERGGRPVSIYDMQLRPGPNRIAEQLDGLRLFKVVPRPGSDATEMCPP